MYRVLVLQCAVAHACGRFPEADGVVEARSAQNDTAFGAGHGDGEERETEGTGGGGGSGLSAVSAALAPADAAQGTLATAPWSGGKGMATVNAEGHRQRRAGE